MADRPRHSLNRIGTTLAAFVFLAAPVARADPGVLKAEDLTPLGDVAWVATGFEMPKMSGALPLVSPEDTSPEASILRRLDSAGTAAGFEGVIYDNHDRGHSILLQKWFPRLAHLQFGEDLREKDLDFGLAGKIILPAIVIGNSSTAINRGPAPRSQPRLAMTTPRYAAQSYLTYISNHLYVYPEHRDHDKEDRFPVNWPYMVISQGSSRSDRPFLRALVMTVAAFPPDTRKRMAEKGLVAPTLQMILRRSQPGIYSRDAYKSGATHPVVFSKKQIAPERMVSLAASIAADDIPPMVTLTVEEDDFAPSAGLAGLSERLFDSPASIARLWRGPEYSKSMTVSAAETKDPNDRDLIFSWVLLQGDPDRVQITPEGPDGRRAEIRVDWHDTFLPDPAAKRTTNRVDIGVFAWNGVHESAPSIISISFPGHQTRTYEAAPDGGGMRLVSIDYDAVARQEYVDPMLYWSAPWTDTFFYGADGKITEWRRKTQDGELTLAAPDRLVDGRPISYVSATGKTGHELSMVIGQAE